MRPDPLPTVLRLRRMEMDAARAELLAAESRAGEAREATLAAQLAIRREMAAACSAEADDVSVEAFAAWLPVGRAAQTRAEASWRRAEEDSIRARTLFNLARGAAEAVEKLIDEQRAAEVKAALVREQKALDEVGGRRPDRGKIRPSVPFL